METRIFRGCSAVLLMVVVGFALLEGTSAMTAYLQPWGSSSLVLHRPQHLKSSFGFPRQHRSLIDDFALSTIHAFPHFPSWSMSPFEENVFDFAPFYRRHRCPARRELNDQHEESRVPIPDAESNKIRGGGQHEKEAEQQWRNPKANCGTARHDERESRAARESRRESRLEAEIERERAEIRRKEALLGEQREQQRREEEEYARRERVWKEKQLNEKQRRMREEEERRIMLEERRRQEELERRRKEDLEKEARKREELRERQRMQAQRERDARDEKRRDFQQKGGKVHEGTRRSPPRTPVHEFVTLAVKGYNPEDISIVARDNKITVSGLHVCGCEESCLEREFQRVYSLPRDAVPTTLHGHVDGDGVLSVKGERHAGRTVSTSTSTLDEVIVPVDGESLHPRNRDSSCGGKRGGIKLKKMNKRTGEVYDDYVTEGNNLADFFEGENGDDGITIEAEE